MVLAGGAMVVLGLWGIWDLATGGEAHNTAGIVIILVVSIALIVFGIVCATVILRAKVVLTPLAIEEHGSLKVKRIARQDIAGYRVRIVQGVNLLEITTKGAKPKTDRISMLFAPDELFGNWFNGIEDFNQTEFASSIEEITKDASSGSSPETRLENINRARTIARVLNATALLAIAWAFFYPRPYELMLLALGVMPWIAIGLCAKYGRLFSIEDAAKASARADLTTLIFLPGIVLGLRALMDTHLVDPTQLIAPSVAGTLVMVGSCLWVEPGLRYRRGYVLLLAAFLASYPAGAIALTNEIFDSARPESFRVTIDSKRHTTGKGATPYFFVSPWGSFKEHNEISVTWSVYQQHNAGESICISLHPGALDLPWYRADEASQC